MHINIERLGVISLNFLDYIAPMLHTNSFQFTQTPLDLCRNSNIVSETNKNA